MNTVKHILLLLSLVLLGSNQAAQAHAVWLESQPVGQKGQAHIVRVYYGEFEAGEVESIKDWYSDLNTLTLQLTAPNGSTQPLSLVDKGDYFEATFTPAVDGVYQVFTRHATKDLGGETRYEFVAQAAVQVGKANQKGNISLGNQLTVEPKIFKVKDKVSILLTADGKPLADKEVAVMSATGWHKNYKTDQNGRILVETTWSGRYVVEFSNMEKNGGEWYGKNYTQNWQGLTASFIVK
ncbi:DUF4198 domain-containing protein [Sphingobacterium sp. MYb382]|uniref:DUF4198 domain-containing protein n=1 Tax=Sphingobacterium sp. MYb382 TaxID=2745278 RepID=UPI00309685E4